MPSGFFSIDKPEGFTSHDVVGKMRRILGMKKVGHSGTLDPMATGVLIVACGTSTRLLDYVQSGTKEYVARVEFGRKTSTGDREGSILDECDMINLTQDQLTDVARQFVGEIKQVPPMVSAIKIKGKKLYEYEREGKQVERPTRDVVIESIVVESFEAGEHPIATLRVSCHAGTYIRTLAEDIAAACGGYAHLVYLRRTKNGTVDEQQLIALDVLEEMDDPFTAMMSPRAVLTHFHHIDLNEEQTLNICHGKLLELTHEQKKIVGESRFAAFGQNPRRLTAMFPGGAHSRHKSSCVIFTDE